MNIQIPSASNSSGTILGILAGTAVTAIIPSMPVAISLAATLGLTPVGLAGIVALGVTSVVNLLVSHVAEIKNLNELVKTWWPQIEQSYPSGTNGKHD